MRKRKIILSKKFFRFLKNKKNFFLKYSRNKKHYRKKKEKYEK